MTGNELSGLCLEPVEMSYRSRGQSRVESSPGSGAWRLVALQQLVDDIQISDSEFDGSKGQFGNTG